jgi:hypothetical protein
VVTKSLISILFVPRCVVAETTKKFFAATYNCNLNYVFACAFT